MKHYATSYHSSGGIVSDSPHHIISRYRDAVNRYYENPREINTMLTNEVYVKAPTSFDEVGGNVNLENSL